MNTIILGTLVLAGLGLIFGIVLGVAAKKFKVEVDPKIEKIRGELPGANCGACGFPGCDRMAKAMATGECAANACPVSSAEAKENIAAIMGVEAVSGDKKVARVLCKGCTDKTTKKFEYEGEMDCKNAQNVQGGDKLCAQGCLGYGSCESVCQFDAIHVVNGIAVVDKEKCAACGECIDVCPRNIIEMVPYKANVVVDCKNNEFGKAVKVECETGCIGCKICEKNCPFDAIHVEGNIAKIDYDKCRECMICVAKCPTGAITGDISTRKHAVIHEDDCVGCTICAKNCPVDAIEGELKAKHKVDPDKCVGCGVCEEKCPKNAIEMVK